MGGPPSEPPLPPVLELPVVATALVELLQEEVEVDAGPVDVLDDVVQVPPAALPHGLVAVSWQAESPRKKTTRDARCMRPRWWAEGLDEPRARLRVRQGIRGARREGA
jgi:hypothetical protein